MECPECAEQCDETDFTKDGICILCAEYFANEEALREDELRHAEAFYAWPDEE